MNYNLLSLILITIVSLTVPAFAEIEKGINYDKEILQTNPDNSQVIKHTLLSYDRILDGNNYKDYIFTETETKLKITTARGFIELDKNSCAFNFDGKFIDSIIAFNSIVDDYSFNAVTQINSSSCEAYYDITEKSLVAKRYASGVGFMEYKYIFKKGEWKTQLEATNLSGLTNRVFAFDQTIDLNRDTIDYGGNIKNLDDFSGQTFNRTWLENNQGKIIDLLNGVNFDFDLGFDSLDSITVTDTGINKSKLTFHYMRSNKILMPDETLIIDPTFGYTSNSDWQRIVGTPTATNCNSVPAPAKNQVNRDVRTPATGAGSCITVAYEFDISSILETDVTVTSVNVRTNSTLVGTGKACDLVFLPTTAQPSVATAANIHAGMYAGTVIVSSNDICTSSQANKVIASNGAGLTDTATRINSAVDWIGIGFKHTGSVVDGTNYEISIDNAELEITYLFPVPPEFEVDIDLENIGDAFKVNGTLSILSGYPTANVTNIIYYVNGSAITTNSTGQNFTSIPVTLNLGPFWYQQTTDSVYNHTVSVTIQDFFQDLYTNHTFNLVTREYDPDYFLALDPTQGFVNYTFPGGNNIINVNRDTGGSLFNVECQYFTQADAFFNNLDQGIWDNQSNVLFYVGDGSGFYYVQCYNDGELFVTPIPQNYSNALVPGLIIFDQLGGFFGAPSIILVIIAILSLATGRNYPIIMLIAASVTGILLALEVLVLDAGLVVAIIVMTGIGLFGIRKFY